MPEMDQLEAAARDFVRDADDDFVDPRRLASVVDLLQGKLARVVHVAERRGDHLLTGQSPSSWVASTCRMSKTAASDRLCVGEQLESLPEVAEALNKGRIGYQSTSVICHLHDKLGEKWDRVDVERLIDYAHDNSVKDLAWATAHTRYVLDPEGCERDNEENYEERFLHISEMKGMYHLTGVMDPEGGAILKSAVDALAKRLGPDDGRTPKQRRADALTELTYHALEAGTMPRRNRVRPHINVNTTLEGLKGELGATASDLQPGMPISSKTVQRLACDGALSRILKADSVVVDVGRATRATSPAQSRALKARYRGCAGPGCDRPPSWTSTHHIEFWARGGPNNLSNMLPLCYYHHRLVHEGGWQVVRARDEVKFIAPDRVVAKRARGPGMRWAA